VDASTLSPETARIYEIVPYDHRKGFPGHLGLYYRCAICGEILPSSPMSSMTCGCGNLFVERGNVRTKHMDKLPYLLKKKNIFRRLFGK
jgi:hypothetical protein